MKGRLKTYNVRITVVDLVNAYSAAEAIESVRQRLESADFDTYEHDEFTPDAIESDIQN